jgi:hypothetical protein
MEHRLNEIDRGNRSTRRGNTYPSATLSTTNPKWTDEGSKSGLRSARPAINSLIHSTVQRWVSSYFIAVTVNCIKMGAFVLWVVFVHK